MNDYFKAFYDPEAGVNVTKDVLGMGGGGSGPRQSASATFAALTRQQWDDYLHDFVPLENQQINYAMNPATVTNAVQQARFDVGRSFDVQQQEQQRRLDSYGLQLTPDEQRASDRSTGLARSLADVTAGNQARQRTVERQQNILGAPTPQAATMAGGL